MVSVLKAISHEQQAGALNKEKVYKRVKIHSVLGICESQISRCWKHSKFESTLQMLNIIILNILGK